MSHGALLGMMVVGVVTIGVGWGFIVMAIGLRCRG